MKIEKFPNNTVIDAYYKIRKYLATHKKIQVAYSGGSDSDTMVDMIEQARQDPLYVDLLKDCEIHYVWCDTGIEYEATKRHISEIEKKYGITIERIPADVPVPLGCQLYGLPFLSKYASQMISRLQKHHFDFAKDGNKPYDELMNLYPKCKSAIGFWCNAYGSVAVKEKSHFNIEQFYGLKEFMIANPPDFEISDKCCKGAKKDPSAKYEKENNIDLKCLGLRCAEGGIRATNIKSCFSDMEGKGCDIYRPIWWFKDSDKAQYKELCGLKYSDCYEKYGFKRTGWTSVMPSIKMANL